ncbi:MAG TPA: NAD(P)/FAD-dependent oxidoreductase [Phycisphaerae bacterium]|nr:NAD(P)/FAD-dependent oxidoreductase [Phycisphaerae bacterium]
MQIEDGSEWDAAVVGAGPAGAVSACLLARRGWRVLLLEKSRWPRDKVCGGCVNAATVATLREIGLSGVLAEATRLDRFRLHVGRRSLDVHLPEGVAISRSIFDARLVRAAEESGVHFVPEGAAKLDRANSGAPFRHLRLMVGQIAISVKARVVVACDGIAGTLLESESWASWRVARHAWFGVSAMVDACELAERGAISMFVGRGGYAGAVVMPAEGGTPSGVHVAAALDPKACRAVGGPAELVARITGVSLGNVRFQGTGLLTRQRLQLGGHRVLAVGDACGYVEPFTGEGIAWAVRGARALVEILPQQSEEWNDAAVESWHRRHAQVVQTRWCRTLRLIAHRPGVAGMGVALASAWPTVARWIGNRISGLPHVQGVGT